MPCRGAGAEADPKGSELKTKADMGIIELGGCCEHAPRNAHLPLVDDCGFNSQERALLDVLRYLCCGLAAPGYDGLRKAIDRARQEWTGPESARIVPRLERILRLIAAARAHAFDFMVPDCPVCRRRICLSELQIILLLREGRRGASGRLTTAAQLVVGSGRPDSLKLAVRELAGLLDATGSRPHTSGTRTLH